MHEILAQIAFDMFAEKYPNRKTKQKAEPLGVTISFCIWMWFFLLDPDFTEKKKRNCLASVVSFLRR